MRDRAPAPVLVTVAVAVVLAGVWLTAPPMGTDLSAQVARADFFADHGWAVLDLRWYGGVSPHGYSLVSPPLMAWLGPRPVGAAVAVVSAWALVELLRRAGARRPMLGGVLGAVAFVGNLVSGRVTFAVGVALGLLALLCLRRAPPSRLVPERGRPPQEWAALGGAFLFTVLASAASPVAGLFLALAGVALLSTEVLGWWRPEGVAPSFPARGRGGGADRPRSPHEGAGRGGRTAAGAALVAGAAAPMAVMAGLFGSGGWMNISGADTLHAVVASLAVVALVPVRTLRAGALLSAAGVLAAYLLTTPVGLNATRLATLFTLPLVAAYATVPARAPGWLRQRPAVALVPLVVALALWQPPVMVGDLAAAGHPSASAAYFAPLREQLHRRQPAGRVEVVPTAHYWESAHLGDLPLARGWLRQADTGRNPLFFDGTLDAGSYREWLADTGVSHVALAGAPLSWVGRGEAELIRDGLPYLTPVWESGDWTLYQVAGATGLVEGPASLLEHRADAVLLEARTPGQVLLRVRWSPLLAVSGAGAACLQPAGDWTSVRVPAPGRYEVTGALVGAGPRC